MSAAVIMLVVALGVLAGVYIVATLGSASASGAKRCYPIVDRADWLLDHEAQC